MQNTDPKETDPKETDPKETDPKETDPKETKDEDLRFEKLDEILKKLEDIIVDDEDVKDEPKKSNDRNFFAIIVVAVVAFVGYIFYKDKVLNGKN